MAKTSSARGTIRRGNRRAELRRSIPRPGFDVRRLLDHPERYRAAIVLLTFAVVVAGIVVWSRRQVRLYEGQVMTETRLKRLDYRVFDVEATEAAQEEARRNAPKAYRPNTSYLDRIDDSIRRLPKAVAGKTSLEEIAAEEVRDPFRLTAEGLERIQRYVGADGEPTRTWRDAVDRLHAELLQNPLLDSETYQGFVITQNRTLAIERTTAAGTTRLEFDELDRSDAIELRRNAQEILGPLRTLAVRAGFDPEIAPFIAARIASEPQPTLRFDDAITRGLARDAASQVAPVVVEHRAGDPLYRRGDVLSLAQYGAVVDEQQKFDTQAPFVERWMSQYAVVAICGVIVLFYTAFAAGAAPRLLRNPLRVLALCLLMAGLLIASATISARSPSFLGAAAVGSTLFVTVVMLLAYDRSVAAVTGIVQASFCALAFDRGVVWLLMMVVGVATLVTVLREVRHRHSLIRAAGATAAVLAATSLVVGLYETPMVPGAWRQILSQAGGVAGASFAVGFLVLGILPSIERLFGITTGMTLAELRDPKQPLLRQLQQRAPGTYNHSLQVANICEAAAEAIGADGLLIYVGALYHDIGKLNKPEYFVENQADGYNRHEKLSPAMSLLVIIGHVKDGVELAREYNLPRPLIHFIESHHGTTLVEYFYHAARTKAREKASDAEVDEVTFRYPGPKPKTREAAIMMLADAVESATRAMAEPNPSRIESLVRTISRKRLTDGQFDQCPLTFRELGLIEDAIISRLNAIHHGRIRYPSKDAPEPAAADEAARSASA